ncbi:hypothetical protein VCHA38O209_80185 [Vibrio chagasii]|nr:hypothetical protein VCHA38O209_80185 [Vibrio chagasii]
MIYCLIPMLIERLPRLERERFHTNNGSIGHSLLGVIIYYILLADIYSNEQIKSFGPHFSIRDPLQAWKIEHTLTDIIVLTISAVEGWRILKILVKTTWSGLNGMVI